LIVAIKQRKVFQRETILVEILISMKFRKTDFVTLIHALEALSRWRVISRSVIPILHPNGEGTVARRGLPGAVKRVKMAINNVMYPAMWGMCVRRGEGRAVNRHVIKRKLNGNTYGIAPIT